MSLDSVDLVMQAIGSMRVVGRWGRSSCPFCILRKGSADKRRSWALNMLTGSWHCFRCHACGYHKESATQVWTGTDTGLLQSLQIAEDETTEELQVDMSLPEEFQLFDSLEPSGDLFDLTAAPKSFLKGRGLSFKVTKELGLGFCMTGKFKRRVLIPFRAPGGESLLGFVGRSFDQHSNLRYLYPAGMPRGEFFFNHDALSKETDKPLIVTEGVFDAIPYWPDAVACLGKPSHQQIALLEEVTKRPVAICLDGDAWYESQWLAIQLKFVGVKAGYVRLPPTKDPGDVNPRRLRLEAAQCIERDPLTH